MVRLTDEEAYELHQAIIAHAKCLRELKANGANDFIREAAAISLPYAESAVEKMHAVRRAPTEEGNRHGKRPYAARHN